MIDLTDITFCEPFGLIYLGMFLRHFNALGKQFVVRAPKNRKVREYLARMRSWERFNFSEDTVEREKLLRHTASTSFNDIYDIETSLTIADEVYDKVLRVLRRSRVNIDKEGFAEAASELVDNFAQHSGSSLAACTMQYYPAVRRVDFAIGDCGIGIRGSLASNPTYVRVGGWEHSEAALVAFDPLVSRKPEGGMGLTGVREAIITSRGLLVLATGDGWVRIDGKVSEVVEVGRMEIDLPGVLIELTVWEGDSE